MLISFGESLECCDISARVLVRSTKESRPSSAERRRTERLCTGWGVSLVGVLGADSMDGMCGARRERAGCWGPKYEDSFLEIERWVAGT